MRRFLLLLAIAVPLHADALTDVRAALGRLTGRQPIRVTYELTRDVHNEGKFGNDRFSGKVAVDVEGDANGIRVGIARPLIEQIEREHQARLKNPKQPAPASRTLEQIDPMRAANAIDYAPALLNLIEGATVAQDSSGSWGGRPARVIVLKLVARPPATEIGKVTVSENRLTLWLGPDHLPLAAEHARAAKFSFLIFRGEGKSNDKWTFATIGDRLVRTRHEATESGSGMGQKGSTHSVEVVRVQ